MHRGIISIAFLISTICGFTNDLHLNAYMKPAKIEIYTRKLGMLIGLQQGQYTSLELGIEHQWKKIRLKDPWAIAVNGTVEYNIKNNILGYKIGGWAKEGRANLTFGLHTAFFTNFDKQNFAIGPDIGIKIIGFHLYTGANILLAKDKIEDVNVFYVGAHYFFVNNRKTKITRDKSKKRRKGKK